MANKHLIIMACSLPRTWSVDYQFLTANELSKRNIVVCCMLADARSIREYMQRGHFPRLWVRLKENLYQYQVVHFLPFRRFRFITLLNYWLNATLVKTLIYILAAKRKVQKKVLWVFDPQFSEFCDMFIRAYVLFFDCVDYFSGIPFERRKRVLFRREEQKLLQRADVVVVNSPILKSFFSRYRQNIEVVPQGFDATTFLQHEKIHPSHNEKSRRHQPVIGYTGAISYRLDFALLIQLAKKNSQWKFVFSGPIQKEGNWLDRGMDRNIQTLFDLPNVLYLGYGERKLVPAIINGFDVTIIPYNTRYDSIRYCFPIKLFEYFYMGKPVVATPLLEVSRFPKFVKIGNTVDEWKTHIANLLSKPWPSPYKKQQKQMALDNSWEKRINKIISFLEEPGRNEK